MVSRALAVLAMVLAATQARPQSADPAFAGDWTWTPETLGAEVTGLGGAYVATARGVDALYWSPAALTYDRGLDLRASLGTRPGLGVVLHGERLHLAMGVRRTFSRRHTGGGFDGGSGIFEVGQLGVLIDQAAFGVGWRSGRLRLGASLAAGPMKANGAWSQVAADGTTGTVVETRYDYHDVREWQFGGASSVLLELLGTHPMARHQARIGAAVQIPTLLRTPRYRRSRLLLRTRDAGVAAAAPPSALTAFDAVGPDLHSFHLPMTMSVGGELRVAVVSMIRSLRLALGADWTDYDRVLRTARGNGGDLEGPLAFDTERPWTFGGGVEADHRLLRLRVGMRERAGHRLVAPQPRPPRQNRARTTFGISRDQVIAGKRIQLDVDSTSAFDDLVLAMRILW